MGKINNDIYLYFGELYEFMQEHIFEEELSDIIFTLHSKKTAYGTFYPDSFKLKTDDCNIHSIAINWRSFRYRSEFDIQSTFLHEIVHLWDELYGKPGKNGYHAKSWANKMHTVGLQPISFDNPEKETGFNCSHLVKDNDIFDVKMPLFNPKVKYSFDSPIIKTRPIINKPKRKRLNLGCPSCNDGRTVRLFEDEIDTFNIKCTVCQGELILL